MLNLLRAVASPADEISLAGVLRSPFFALADETLFWLVDIGRQPQRRPASPTSCRRNSRPKNAPKSPPPPTRFAISARSKTRVPIATLLERSARPHRLRRRAAGRVPRRTQARQPAQAHRAGPHRRPRRRARPRRLHHPARRSSSPASRRKPLAATLPEAADVIRLMTIHHAKGLEFPLVIVPDLDRQPRLRRAGRRARPAARPARAAAQRR